MPSTIAIIQLAVTGIGLVIITPGIWYVSSYFKMINMRMQSLEGLITKVDNNLDKKQTKETCIALRNMDVTSRAGIERDLNGFGERLNKHIEKEI